MRICLPVFVLTLLVASPRGFTKPGFAVGGSHVVQAGVSPTSGIEVGMPRISDYAIGIAYDMRSKWRQSYHAFAKAFDKFKRDRSREGWRPIVEGWMEKARFQMVQSSRMLAHHRQKYTKRSAVSRVYDRASVLHNKWLAIRAFRGRAPYAFQQRVLRDYRLALRIKPGHRPSRIGLATFFHEIGRRADARREFALVIRPIPSWLDVEVAHYFAAAGLPLPALRKLHHVAADAATRRHVLWSNDFDLLRNHPAFRRLMGLR